MTSVSQKLDSSLTTDQYPGLQTAPFFRQEEIFRFRSFQRCLGEGVHAGQYPTFTGQGEAPLLDSRTSLMTGLHEPIHRRYHRAATRGSATLLGNSSGPPFTADREQSPLRFPTGRVLRFHLFQGLTCRPVLGEVAMDVGRDGLRVWSDRRKPAGRTRMTRYQLCIACCDEDPYAACEVGTVWERLETRCDGTVNLHFW